MLMGVLIGLGQALNDRSRSKIRNGLIGGAFGGLIGGILFDPISVALTSASGMSSRATAFVILGIFIGALIGAVQVVLKEAWLTVLDGYRPGRQLILGDSATLGRAEFATLSFSGPNDEGLDQVHLRITRQPNGRYRVEDSRSRSKLEATVNEKPIQWPVELKDGDILSLGKNLVRFSERTRKGSESAAPSGAPVTAASPPPRPVAVTLPRSAAPPSQLSTPAPAAPPRIAPRPAAPAGNVCPQCQTPVPAGQRYCIKCDVYF
jgi:hypothetical protein